ncbi:DNA replication/repair protein RecF [Candidatus Peregrinibacteria bacterium]|nr:DNA replication/repair protein RecF [Candidatus Peregrinibacteria bacterium]
MCTQTSKADLIASWNSADYAWNMLKSLELENFRNYGRLRLDFKMEAGLTYLIGDNGQGKTNLLEAIYMLALGKSFRISDEESLIKWSTDFGRVRGVFGGSSMEIFLGRPPQPRRVFKVNEVKSSAVNFVGRLRAVFFHPEDLNVLYLGPDLRRRYLDIMILQKNRAYFTALRKFKRLKEQRNSLLWTIREGRGSVADLDIWDEQIVREAVIIWKGRAEALSFIAAHLTEKYESICGKKTDLRIGYLNNLDMGYEMIVSTKNLEEVYASELMASQDRDIASGHTQVGPHRDDMAIYLGGKPIMEHASRGEIRTILLALKLIEMDYFSEDGEQPILLLDDVFSELDHERQRYLLERVVNYQTFITTTKDSVVINQEKLLAGDFVEIVNGKII